MLRSSLHVYFPRRHEGHEGSDIYVPNFVRFVSFVVNKT